MQSPSGKSGRMTGRVVVITDGASGTFSPFGHVELQTFRFVQALVMDFALMPA
jgi:hypothetical protein